MPDTRRDSFGDDVRRIETSDRQNREGLCVPKIRFCNTGGEGRPESGVT
jgi:hypothetical protein